jgi:crossover junction endodeoxyribonuclease RuvC
LRFGGGYLDPRADAGFPVSTSPGQGVSSTFAFGRAYGIVIGILVALGTPMTFVSPAKWKRALGVPSVKDGARARASQLLPQASSRWPLKRHDGRAEAALLALYGLRSLTAGFVVAT